MRRLATGASLDRRENRRGAGGALRILSRVSGFVDVAQCNVKGGDGGAGCVAFRREAHVPAGGPDGGDGGRGGDVWLRANRNVASLLAFRDHPHRKAGSGTHGSGKKQHGKGGADLVVDVPEGTVVYGARQRAARRPRAATATRGSRRAAARAGAATRASCRTRAARRASPSRASTARSGGSSSS